MNKNKSTMNIIGWLFHYTHYTHTYTYIIIYIYTIYIIYNIYIYLDGFSPGLAISFVTQRDRIDLLRLQHLGTDSMAFLGSGLISLYSLNWVLHMVLYSCFYSLDIILFRFPSKIWDVSRRNTISGERLWNSKHVGVYRHNLEFGKHKLRSDPKSANMVI
jgi:hypothetical protein